MAQKKIEEEIKRDAGAIYDCQKTAKNGYKRSHAIEIQLQNLANSYWQGRPIEPQEEEDIFLLWSKMMMMVIINFQCKFTKHIFANSHFCFLQVTLRTMQHGGLRLFIHLKYGWFANSVSFHAKKARDCMTRTYFSPKFMLMSGSKHLLLQQLLMVTCLC